MDLIGFEGRYEIFEDGTIISLFNGKAICQWIDNVGYMQVSLMKKNKRYYRRVHRLVAEHFIENIHNNKQVNHIDGDKLNNDISNLEWVDNSTNTQHGYDNGLYHSKKRCISVEVYDKQGKYINTYKSIRETAEKLGINRKTLSRILFYDKSNNYEYDFKVTIN